MLLKGIIKPSPGKDKDGKKMKAFPVRLSAWGWGPPQGPQWCFWERILQIFAFPAHSARFGGKGKQESGCWGSHPNPWLQGCHVHSCQAGPGDSAGTTATTCLVSLQQPHLVQKPGFPWARALTWLHRSMLGDKERSAKVPLMGQSGERSCSRAPHPPANTSQGLSFAFHKDVGCLPQTQPPTA